MVTLLARLILGSIDPASPKGREKYGILCGCVGIVLNLLLFGGKAFAGAVSGSIAITADAFNNLSDAGASLITLLGFRLAAQRPDRGHPFGHGRFEYISGFVVSMLILLMAFELGRGSVDKILHPEPVEASLLAGGILVASIAVKLYMAFYNRQIGRKIGSPAMHATAMDSLSDAASTAAVLLSMVLAYAFDLQLDGWFGLLVAVFIAYTGISTARETLSPLLGQAPDPELVAGIKTRVLAYPGVTGVHDLIVHDYGPGRLMISLHAEVPSDGDMLTLHDTIDTIERALQEEFNCHAVIHMDPLDTNDGATAALRLKVEALVRDIAPVLCIHDFRIVSGPTHTNMIFDVVAPFDFSLTDAQLTQAIEQRVAGLDGRYYLVLTIDKDYA